MASRGPRRPAPVDPPWWFNLMLVGLAAMVTVLALWPVGYAAHVWWQLFLHGWQAA